MGSSLEFVRGVAFNYPGLPTLLYRPIVENIAAQLDFMPFANKGALVLDLNGRIAFASTYFCDLVGVEHDKIAGRSYFDFVFPEEVQEAKKRFEPCKSVIPLPFRFRLRTSKGAPVWTSIQCAPMQTATGDVYAVSATITVTEQPGNGNAEKP